MVTMPGAPIETYDPESRDEAAAAAKPKPPYKPEMGVQVKPEVNPYEAFQGDTDLAERMTPADPGWKDRFAAWFSASQDYGTPGIDELKDIQSAEQGYVNGVGIGPEAGKATADLMRSRRADRQAEFDSMSPAGILGNPAKSLENYAAAVGGAVAGAVADPASLLQAPVKIGSAGWRIAYPMLSRILESGTSNAAMNAAINATVQAEEYGAGMREEVDWLSLGIDAAAGFGFGVPFGYAEGRAAQNFYAQEAARAAPQEAPAQPGTAPAQPAPNQAQGLEVPTPEQMQTEFTAADLAQAQVDLFGEVIGTRNLTPEQLAQLDAHLMGGKPGDIPQAPPETEGGLSNDAPPTSVRDAFKEADAAPVEAPTAAAPPEAKPDLSTDPATVTGTESVPALQIGGKYFTGQTHAEALDKAIQQFGADSPEIKAFEAADNPLDNIGVIRPKQGWIKSITSGRPEGFAPGITGGNPKELTSQIEAARQGPDLTTLPDSAIKALPDIPMTAGGNVPLARFTPEEQDALRAAGLVTSETNADGVTFEAVDPNPMWAERTRRAEAARAQGPKVVTLEEKRAAAETRASLFDQGAIDAEAAGDAAKAADYKAKAAEIRAKAPPPPPLPIDRTERQFAPSELKVDAKRFQFKEGGDEAGVTDRLKGVKKWDPIKSGVTLVWEDLNGDFYIADGHQRHGLASRLEKEGQDPKIRAVVLREADGVSAEDARAIAAAKNIAEGTGNAIDAAKILRSRPDMGVDLPPTSALVRDAQGLASLSDDAFGMVINKKVPAGYAAQVGRLAPDPKTHAQLLELLAKEQPDNAIEAESMIRDALEAPAVQSTMEDMFGSAEVTQILFKERAQVLSAAATAIRKDRAAFATLVREEARLTGAGNQLATQTNAERASQDAEILANLQAQARRKGPIADALAAAARKLKDGQTRQTVVRDFLNDVRRSTTAVDENGGGAGAAGRADETGIAARIEQAPRVDSPAFRQWFGSSKVVDDQGKPLVVYHGTARGGFDSFDTYASNYGLMGQGGYFTESPTVADSYTKKGAEKIRRQGEDPAATVYPVYLAIENPLDMDGPANLDAWANAYSDHVSRDSFDGVTTNEEAYRVIEDALRDEQFPMYEGAEIMQDGIRKMGYDGITHIGGGRVDSAGERHRVWIAFDPEQIKSVFNRGTWDAADPNIAFSRRRPVQEGPGLFDAAPKAPGISPQMERVLTMSSGKMGAPDNIYGDQINEAVRNGWIAMQSGYTATGNSKTRYFITDAGRQVLAGGQPQPKPVERPTSMPERQAAFREEVERLRAEKAELERSIFAAIDKDGAFSAETADGRTIIVTKSLRDPSLYQITNIDRNGEATGHFDSRGTDLASDVRSTGVKLGVKLGVKPRAEAPPPSGGLFDTGAENKPQAVIPGAGRISDKRLAEMRGAAPLKAQRPQKGMDVGLFGSERDQTDLFSQPSTPQAPPEITPQNWKEIVARDGSIDLKVGNQWATIDWDRIGGKPTDAERAAVKQQLIVGRVYQKPNGPVFKVKKHNPGGQVVVNYRDPTDGSFRSVESFPRFFVRDGSLYGEEPAAIVTVKPFKEDADFGLFAGSNQLDLVDLSVAKRLTDDASQVDLRPSGTSRSVRLGNSTIIYAARPDEVQILAVRTPIPLRRQGAAREAMVAFLEKVDEQGLPVRISTAPLDRMTNMDQIQRFYESLGFTATGKVDRRGGAEMLRSGPPPELANLRKLVGSGRLIPLKDYRESGMARLVGEAFIGSQPERTFNELYGGALQRNQNKLAKVGQRIADELGINFGNPGVKKRDTAEGKVGRKGYRSTKQLTDLVRAGFKVQLPEQGDRLVMMLAEEFQVLDEGWAVSDVSYFDRKVLVKFDDGTIGEVQIWEPSLYDAKNPVGHGWYMESRDLPNGDPRKLELEQMQRDRYESVIATLPEPWLAVLGRSGNSGNVSENASRQASSGMGFPDSTTSATSTSVQASPGASTAQALGPSDTAGRNSQSKNFMGDNSVSGEPKAPVAANQPEGGASPQADPLTQPGGDWRTAEIEVMVDGEPVMVPAGEAVDFLVKRRAALKQLVECLDAA